MKEFTGLNQISILIINVDLFAVTAIPLAPALKIEFPEIEEIVRLAGDEDILMMYEDKEFL
jgi:hypothetical protein